MVLREGLESRHSKATQLYIAQISFQTHIVLTTIQSRCPFKVSLLEPLFYSPKLICSCLHNHKMLTIYRDETNEISPNWSQSSVGCQVFPISRRSWRVDIYQSQCKAKAETGKYSQHLPRTTGGRGDWHGLLPPHFRTGWLQLRPENRHNNNTSVRSEKAVTRCRPPMTSDFS